MEGAGMGDQDQLLHGERLLLRTVRLLALATPCHGLRAHFEAACGTAGREAYGAVEVFVQQLRRHGRRRLALSGPSDPRRTGDEALVLAAFAAAQAGDYRGLDRWLTALMGAAPPASLGAAACLAAQILELNGLVLGGQHHAQQDRGPVCGRRGDHVAVPDGARELQPLVHVEDDARRIEHPARHQEQQGVPGQ